MSDEDLLIYENEVPWEYSHYNHQSVKVRIPAIERATLKTENPKLSVSVANFGPRGGLSYAYFNTTLEELKQIISCIEEEMKKARA